MIPDRLGQYEILGELGSGGMGVAYHAHDRRLERPVVLKTLLEAPEGKLRARLIREARAAAGLQHPGICTIYAVEEVDDRVFIAMEYVAGRTLSAVLKEGPVEPSQVADYGRQVAEALAFAHDRGILHGDVKPSNLMLTGEGRLKILDFGVARVLPGADVRRLTESSDAFDAGSYAAGTIAYMSPERLSGDEEGDPRSDLWALGLVLYELATGVNPFLARTTVATLTKVLHQEIMPPSRVRPGLPASLERVILSALERDVERRPSSGRAMAEALRAATASVRPSSAGRRTLAVLPFVDLARSAGESYFADGITMELISRLARLRELMVISRTSVMRFRGSREDVRDIGRELGVEVIVEGTVRRHGERCQLWVQLVDAGDGFHMWSDSYDVPMDEIFDVQAVVSRGIAEALSLPQPRAVVPTRDMRAFEAYLRALHAYHKFTSADNRVAMELLGKALELDPGYAEAHALLANAYVACVERGWEGNAERWLGRALESCTRALSLDPGISRAHSARASVHFASGALDAAEADVAEALRQDPSNDIALDLLGRVHLFRGEFDAAIEAFRAALEINPYYVWCLNDLAWAQWLTGDLEGSEETLGRVLSISPEDEAGHSGLAGLRLLEGRLDEALAQARRAEASNPRYPFVLMLLPLILARRGDVDEALERCRALLEADPSNFVGHATLGTVLAAAGDEEGAAEAAEKALAIRPFYPPLSLNYAALYDLVGLEGLAARWVAKAREEGVRLTPDAGLHPIVHRYLPTPAQGGTP